MDRYVTLEETDGIGTLWQGATTVMTAVPYSIRVSQRMIDVSSMSGRAELPGLKSIEGWLESDIPFELIGAELVLELQDGRRWDCFVQSSGGNLVNRGGLR